MLELATGAQFVPSHDISTTTVAVPAGEVACTTSAGAARAISTSTVGPVVVSVPPSCPEGHVLVAATALEATSKRSGRRNLTLPARILANVRARFACRFVCVDAFELGFKTWLAYAAVDLPALAAFAPNAPGCFMTSPRGFPKSVPACAIITSGAAGGGGIGRQCLPSCQRGLARAVPGAACPALLTPCCGRRSGA